MNKLTNPTPASTLLYMQHLLAPFLLPNTHDGDHFLI